MPHRFPLLMASDPRGAAYTDDFRRFLATAYLRAITRTMLGAAHPCERAEGRPLLVSYLVAALAEEPADPLLPAALGSTLRMFSERGPDGNREDAEKLRARLQAVANRQLAATSSARQRSGCSRVWLNTRWRSTTFARR